MKKKLYKKAKGDKRIQFPSNYRAIPEKVKGDGFVFFIGLLFIISAIFVVSFDLYSNYKKKQSIAVQKAKILNDLSFWEKEVNKRPDYRDGYFTLALLNYQLRRFNEANKNLKISLDLDPNFKEGKELKSLLESNF